MIFLIDVSSITLNVLLQILHIRIIHHVVPNHLVGSIRLLLGLGTIYSVGALMPLVNQLGDIVLFIQYLSRDVVE